MSRLFNGIFYYDKFDHFNAHNMLEMFNQFFKKKITYLIGPPALSILIYGCLG